MRLFSTVINLATAQAVYESGLAAKSEKKLNIKINIKTKINISPPMEEEARACAHGNEKRSDGALRNRSTPPPPQQAREICIF